MHYSALVFLTGMSLAMGASPSPASAAASGTPKDPAAASAPAHAQAMPATPLPDSVAVGHPAPDFTLPAQDGKPIGPKDVAGRWVVLYFYPKDFTNGCSLEARNFQKDSAAYAKAGAVILGVSMDPPKSHEEFCAKEGLGFKLLADTAGAVSARYGSLGEMGGKKLSKRHTFLIDPDGKVARIYRDVKPAAHSGEVLAALAELGAARKK